jgi:hypothetical protein
MKTCAEAQYLTGQPYELAESELPSKMVMLASWEAVIRSARQMSFASGLRDVGYDY